jgi:ribosomal protein S18 acetylase RimI-like enzyme
MRVVLLQPGDEALMQRTEDLFYPGGLKAERAAELLREPSYLMVVALDESGSPMGRIYGHLLHRFEATDFLLYEVDVHDDYQRRGAGRAMVEFLREECRARDVREMWVLTELDNEAGNALYSSTGGSLENSPANMYVFPIQ